MYVYVFSVLPFPVPLAVWEGFGLCCTGSLSNYGCKERREQRDLPQSFTSPDSEGEREMTMTSGAPPKAPPIYAPKPIDLVSFGFFLGGEGAYSWESVGTLHQKLLAAVHAGLYISLLTGWGGYNSLSFRGAGTALTKENKKLRHSKAALQPTAL